MFQHEFEVDILHHRFQKTWKMRVSRCSGNCKVELEICTCFDFGVVSFKGVEMIIGSRDFGQSFRRPAGRRECCSLHLNTEPQFEYLHRGADIVDPVDLEVQRLRVFFRNKYTSTLSGSDPAADFKRHEGFANDGARHPELLAELST